MTESTYRDPSDGTRTTVKHGKVPPALRTDRLAVGRHMNEEELKAYVSLSTALGGHVRHPKYLPPHERPGCLEILSTWCTKHARTSWPSWLRDLVDSGELPLAGGRPGDDRGRVPGLHAGS